jgi:hypothetical protein
VRWRVKEIVHPTGVTVTFTYAEQTLAQQCDLFRAAGFLGPNEGCHGDDPNSERASYFTQMEYPGTRVRVLWDRRWNGNGPHDGFGAPAYRWDFAAAGMAALFWQTDAVQKVVLERRRGDGTWAVAREIRFTYGTFIPEDESNKRLRILTAIQEWAPEGNAWKALPPFTFGYTGYPNKDGCNVFAQPCSEWDQARFFYPRLTRIDNGYGGVIEVGYETPDGGHWQAKNYRVAWRQVADGLGGGWREDLRLQRRQPGAVLSLLGRGPDRLHLAGWLHRPHRRPLPGLPGSDRDLSGPEWESPAGGVDPLRAP